MGFAVAQLPYVTLWKNLTALEEGYVTGLEPGTGFPYTRRLEREAGRVPRLNPGETRRFAIDVGLHASAAEVTKVENEIERIQAGRPVQVDRMAGAMRAIPLNRRRSVSKRRDPSDPARL